MKGMTFKQVDDWIDENHGYEFGDWILTTDNNNGSWYFETWSPAGENLVIEYDPPKGPMTWIDEMYEYVKGYGFDADEHVEMLMESRGENGVPSSVRVLVEDAEAIADMYRALANELQKLAEDFRATLD